MAKRVVLTGGGSGGHIYPLVAVADALRQKDPSMQFLYIGTKAQYGATATEIMAAENIRTKNVMAGKLRRYFSFSYFTDLFIKMPFGLIQALWHLLWFMPDAIFSKGGYVSVPVVIAAWIYNIPVLTHESDAVPGWANRVIGKFSRYIATSFPSTKKFFRASKVVLTGNPIRKELTQGSAQRGRERWSFSESQPVVFVVGGSQGARAVNNAILRVLPRLEGRAQVLHATGEGNYDEVLQQAGELGFKSGRRRYVALASLSRDEMADAYALADVIISRAGANSLTEIAANKKPSIIIPLRSHDQPKNAMEFMRSADPQQVRGYDPMKAYQLAQAGGAIVLSESNLGENLLLQKIEKLLTDEKIIEQMSDNVGTFYHPDAAEKIADGVVKMIG